MNTLHLSLHSFVSHASLVSTQYMDLCKTWPFSYKIFALMSHAWTNINALPQVSTQLKMVIWIQRHFVWKHHTHKPFKSDVSLDIIISGFSPSHSYISWTVFDLTYESSYRQSFPSPFGTLDLIIFLPEPLFGSFVSFLAAFNHGVMSLWAFC